MAVALGERAAAAILAGETHREAFIHQRRKGEMLGRGPVEPLPLRDGLRPVVDDTGQRAVNVDAFRHRRDGLADRLEPLLGDAGLATAFVVMRQAEAFPFAVQPVGFLGFEILAGVKLAVEIDFEIRHLLLDLLRRQKTLFDEALGVDFARRDVALDLLVHHRLGEHGLVALIVTEAPVAEHVDDDILVELLPVLGRHLGGIGHRFGVIAIDVEDRGLDHQRHIGRVRRRPRIHRAGGEADLVVHDEVDRAAGAIALKA